MFGDIGQIVYFCKADLNMAKEIDIRNGAVVLSEAIGVLHERFCCSPSGCLPSREAVDSQGAAIGENLLRHFVPSSFAGLFSGGQSLQDSGRYFLLQYSFCCSPSGCLPSRVAVNSQGAAIGENLLRHFVPSSFAESFSGRQSLKGSDRYFLRQSRRHAPADAPSMSLKGSYRNSPAA